jgi:hypothetical protein
MGNVIQLFGTKTNTTLTINVLVELFEVDWYN